MEPLLISVISFVISLLFCSLFAFLETSVTALRLFKLKELANTTENYRSLFAALEKNPHHVLVSILIANSLANVTAAALSTHIMQEVFARLHFSGNVGFSLGIALATVSLLIFGEVIPKNVAKRSGERFFRSTLWLINLTFLTLRPLVALLDRFSNFVLQKIDGSKGASSQYITSEKEIQFLISQIRDQGAIESEKKEMLQNIFEIGITPIKEIMVPLTDIVSIPANTTTRKALELFRKHQFSRFPVYENSKDNIIGMIHLKDISNFLLNNDDVVIKNIVRPILFIPHNIKVNQLLRQFRQQNMHIAMVVNEFGGITGLVTLEDVLEEIVGEISDEHELASEKITPLKSGGWLVEASVSLEELEELLDITFRTEDAVTLGGFMTEQLQCMPKKGDRVIYRGYVFQVQKASPKRVFRVLIFEEHTVQPASLSDK